MIKIVALWILMSLSYTSFAQKHSSELPVLVQELPLVTTLYVGGFFDLFFNVGFKGEILWGSHTIKKIGVKYSQGLESGDYRYSLHPGLGLLIAPIGLRNIIDFGPSLILYDRYNLRSEEYEKDLFLGLSTSFRSAVAGSDQFDISYEAFADINSHESVIGMTIYLCFTIQ